MFHKTKTLNGYKLNSLDGEVGDVIEFYFDDKHWTIRYLVVDTGNWLTDRQVLISPYAFVNVNEGNKNIAINLTKQQIENSPPLDSKKPVSRQFESRYYAYYGWPMYYSGSYSTEEQELWDPNLRSTKDVIGHHIQAKDGKIGHVEDFVIDDKTWAIRYMIVNVHNWLPGKKVLISTRWIDDINWNESKVVINLSREAIKNSPKCTDELLLTRDYETKLHAHYNLQGYWVDELEYPKKSILSTDDKKVLNKTSELRSLLVSIFADYFDGNSLELAKDIIWSNDFYANIFLTSSWIAHDDNLLKKVAYDIYACSEKLNIRSTSRANADTDCVCAARIIEDKKITNSIILMGKLIHEFSILRQKISWLLENVSNHEYKAEDNLKITKHLIRGGENNLEDNLQQYFSSNETITKIMQESSFVTNLKKAWRLYHENSDIFSEDDNYS